MHSTPLSESNFPVSWINTGISSSCVTSIDRPFSKIHELRRCVNVNREAVVSYKDSTRLHCRKVAVRVMVWVKQSPCYVVSGLQRISLGIDFVPS